MEKKFLVNVALVTVVVFAISGCGTAHKKTKTDEITTLKTRVEALETRVDTVEAKQTEPVATAAVGEEYTSKRMPRSNIGTRPTDKSSSGRIKDVQTCLKNAGFYDGKIDGVKGKNTKKAIKKFQKANGLKADGVVGKRTWELLSKYSSGAAGGM